MKLSDFDFLLPDSLIAQHPPAVRGNSRLLVASKPLQDQLFPHILSLLSPNDLLVLNNTRVIKARLFGHKASGGKVEIMVERITNAHSFVAMIKASNAPKPGTVIELPGQTRVEVTGRDHALFVLKVLECPLGLDALLEQYGTLPLPPYITHAATETDEQRYQTVYAKQPGAVAAPTAGLHFTDEILQALAAKGVEIVNITLHVGAGTFYRLKAKT